MDKIKETTGVKGIYRITECIVNDESLAFSEKMKKTTGKVFTELLQEYHKLFSIKQEVFHNIVPAVGLNTIVDNLFTSSPAPENVMNITYGALGTGTIAGADGDTTLGNEEFRAVISSKSKGNKVHYTTLFLDNNTGNGFTYTEFGLFNGNATGVTDSGTLFSRVLLSPSFEKTNAKSLTIEASHTLSSV